MIFWINPTWMIPSAHIKVRINVYLLCGDILLYLGLFRGAVLGCIFDTLDLIFDVFSPLMSIFLIFNWPMFVLDLSCYRGAKFVHLHWGIGGVLVLEKCQNVELWNFMWANVVWWKNALYLWGRSSKPTPKYIWQYEHGQVKIVCQ